MRAALAAALVLSLWAAAPAAGHSVMKVEGGVIHYTANDDVSLNDLSVTIVGDEVRFRDPGADGGIQKPEECNPGTPDANGNFVEMHCPRAGISSVRIDVGEAQDKVAAQIALPVLVLGGAGADTITTGDGNDILNGGSANDVLRSAGGNDQVIGDAGDDRLVGEGGDDMLQGGVGADTADAGAGNDDVRIRDGAVDQALCGDGGDRVQADDRDGLDACETVDSVGGSAPQSGAGDGPAPPDTVAPRLRAGGSTLQRAGRSGRVVVVATASEPSELVAAGYVTAGNRRFVLRQTRAPIAVGGGGARLRLTLSRADGRRLWRMLRAGRRAHATISVVATDTAGNSASSKLPRIALRR
jgi:hypothetical protein